MCWVVCVVVVVGCLRGSEGSADAAEDRGGRGDGHVEAKPVAVPCRGEPGGFVQGGRIPVQAADQVRNRRGLPAAVERSDRSCLNGEQFSSRRDELRGRETVGQLLRQGLFHERKQISRYAVEVRNATASTAPLPKGRRPVAA